MDCRQYMLCFIRLSLLAIGCSKFAEQERSNGGDRLLAAQRCVKAERAGERGIRFRPLLSAFLFNAVIFPGTKRLLTYSQDLEERLGVPGNFYSLIEKRKSFAPELHAPGCLSLCFSPSMRKTPELFQLRLC